MGRLVVGGVGHEPYYLGGHVVGKLGQRLAGNGGVEVETDRGMLSVEKIGCAPEHSGQQAARRTGGTPPWLGMGNGVHEGC